MRRRHFKLKSCLNFVEKEIRAIKCVVIGDGDVGKTCMLCSYTYNYYPGDSVSSVVADIFSSTTEIDQRQIRLSLWDTAEQPDYDHLSPLAYPNSDVILICFSIMNCESFRNVELIWHPEVNKFCPCAKIILVGTKLDLRYDEAAKNKLRMTSNEEPISYSEGVHMAKKINALQYFECSALTRAGLAEVFDAVVRSALFPFNIEHKNSGVKRDGESMVKDSDLGAAKSLNTEDIAELC